MSLSNDVKLTFKYADDTTRVYTIPNIPSNKLLNIAQGVRNVNSSLPTAATVGLATPIRAFYELFISPEDEESHVVKISSAKIISKQEEIIYGN